MATWTRKELKSQGKMLVKAYYWKMVLAGLIMFALTGGMGSAGSREARSKWDSNTASNSLGSAGIDTTLRMRFLVIFGMILLIALVALVIGMILRALIVNPLIIGCQGFFIHSIMEEPELSDILGGFRGNYLNVVKTTFLRDLFISLWSLLFVIPGIIKSYEYRMVPYLLAEDPYMDSSVAFAESKAMMDGNKWDAFVLDLSFIGWILLGAITFGVVQVFWTGPYIYTTDAALYHALQRTPGSGMGSGYGTAGAQMPHDYKY